MHHSRCAIGGNGPTCAGVRSVEQTRVLVVFATEPVFFNIAAFGLALAWLATVSRRACS